jgi:hypothetical protein
MQYQNYQDEIMKNAGMKLVGWPADVEFRKPGAIGATSDLRKIWKAIECKELYFRALTNQESDALIPQIAAGVTDPRELASHDTNLQDQQSIPKRKRRERSDKGKPRGPRKQASRTENDENISPVDVGDDDNGAATTGSTIATQPNKRKQTEAQGPASKRRRQNCQ